ncbi:MAG: type II toxin-antitoxin system RelE/ParE family toxin [Gammaproteobacteria bacterium]
MKHTVRVRKPAQHDIEDAARWYESQREGLGSQFLDEIEQAFVKISESPLIYPEVHRETRRAVLQRFPFGVFFRISGNTVSVVAVMHSSRDPNQWKTRT